MMTTHGAKRRMIARFSLAFALLAALFASMISLGTARAQVPVASGQPYNQTFDSLPMSGSQPWTDDVTIEGWYAAAENTTISPIGVYNTDSPPASPENGLYSFGASATSNERALGVIGNSTGNPKRFGVVLRNTSSAPIPALTISYTGEQWLDANVLTTTEQLQFKYKQGTNLGAADFQTSIGLTNYPNLNFVSPQNAGAGALDGNAPANSRAMSATLDLDPDLPVGGEILLLWEKDNVSGNDDGLAVDNLTITTRVAAPQATCPATITASTGSQKSAVVSAADPNGLVTSASLAVNPASPGITLMNQTPATTAGGTYTATLNVADTTAPGNYQATITFSNNDAAVETATCVVNITVSGPVPSADFSTSRKTVSATAVQVGQVFTYTLTVVNRGNAAGSFTLTDQLPSMLEVVSTSSGLTVGQTSSGKALTASGTLNGEQQIVYTVGVKASVAGTVNNTANVTSNSITTALTAPPVTVSSEPVRYKVYMPLIVRGT